MMMSNTVVTKIVPLSLFSKSTRPLLLSVFTTHTWSAVFNSAALEILSPCLLADKLACMAPCMCPQRLFSSKSPNHCKSHCCCLQWSHGLMSFRHGFFSACFTFILQWGVPVLQCMPDVGALSWRQGVSGFPESRLIVQGQHPGC